jgi:hypothetical protein
MENVEIQGVEARRSFLKKVAYVAPAVVVLGSLTLPNSAQASTFTGEARVNPGDTLIGVSTVTGENGAVGAAGGGTYQRVYSNGSTGTVQSYTGAQVVENKMGVFTWAQKFFGNILG